MGCPHAVLTAGASQDLCVGVKGCAAGHDFETLPSPSPRSALSIATARCPCVLCAAGGFNPGRVLPCVIDVGTNNELLRSEPW